MIHELPHIYLLLADSDIPSGAPRAKMAVPLRGTAHVQASSSGQQLEAVKARGYAALFAVVPNPGGGRWGAAARHVRNSRAGVPQSVPGTRSDRVGRHDTRQSGE